MIKTGDKYNNLFILIVLLLIVLDVFVWHTIITKDFKDEEAIYFLDVGQGDSSLINLSGGVQILIDGGPSAKVLDGLNDILSPTDRYIDLVVLTHPQADHLNGLIDVLKRYEVGMFLYNGDEANIGSYEELEKILSQGDVSYVVVKRGDEVTYGDSKMTVLWPPENFVVDDPNDKSVVIKLKTSQISALFTGDISNDVENYLLNTSINSSILKVPHHGSKYASSKKFLDKVSPKVSVIGVGKNSYGHPTNEAISRLASVGSQVFRTDLHGLLKLVAVNGSLNIYSKK